jgi:hypothetical protein
MSPLLCRVLGHKWEPIVVTRVGGESRRYCAREQKWIVVFHGWKTHNQGRRDVP